LQVAACLAGLAMIAAAKGDYTGALSLLQRTTSIENAIIFQVFSISSENQRVAYLESMFGSFHAFLSLVLLRLSGSGAAVQAALDLVLQRKAVGMDVLLAQRQSVLAGRYPSLRSKLDELTALRTQIAQKVLEGPGSEELAAHQATLGRWSSERDRLEMEL